jgi:hypothetical protein
MYQGLYMVEVGLYEERYASLRLSSFDEVGPKTVRRGTAPQPVLTSDKLPEIERPDYPPESTMRLGGM